MGNRSTVDGRLRDQMLTLAEGSKKSRSNWRAILRSRRMALFGGALAWLAGAALALVAGDVPPDPGSLTEEVGHRTGPRSTGVRTWLSLRQISGWPRDLQREARESLSTRWRGSGAGLWGILSENQGDLYWSPTPFWEERGAKPFLLRRTQTDRLEVTNLPFGSVGVVVFTHESGQLWLWARGPVREVLATFAREVGSGR